MSNALIKPESTQLTTYRDDQVQLIKDTFAKGASDSELKLFIAVAERKGLDIFSRQIHLVKRYDKKLNREVMEVQTGIDGYRLIAERTGRYEGQIGPMWCGNDGNWKDVWLAKEPPAAAKVGILKSGAKEPFFGIALYREYVQTYKEGIPFPMWAKMPANQLAKCAEALALRKAFPGELSGIYTQEEMAQATTAEDVIDIEPIREEKPVKPPAPVPPARESEGEPLRLRPEQVEQLESVPIDDPLPETQNTENERIEQERIALIAEMKTTWLTASSESDWGVFTGKYDLYGMSIKDLKGTLNKIKEKATAILAAKAQPKSNEPASGYAAQREDGTRKVLRKNESGELEAQWEKPVADEPKKSKLKAVVDEVIAEHWPNTPEGYNEGYKATRAKMESLIGPFKNFEDINAADQAKLIAALGRWNPADDKPKAKGKK